MLNLCLWIGNICNGLLLGNASIARGLTCCKKLARHEASRKSWSTKFPLGGEVNHIWPLAYRFQCGLCKKYCKASDRLLECEDCEKRFHASCSNLSDNELLRIESGDGAWYCTNCKADCGLCSGAVLKGHKAVVI